MGSINNILLGIIPSETKAISTNRKFKQCLTKQGQLQVQHLIRNIDKLSKEDKIIAELLFESIVYLYLCI